MARPSDNQVRQFAALIEAYEPKVRQAFMTAVTDFNDQVDWKALLNALESGSTYSAIAALNISEAAFSAYSQVLTAAFIEAGNATARTIVKSGYGNIGLRFDAKNPRAEQWIRENVGQEITRITKETELAARTLIEAGYAAGNHPHTIALDLIGRAKRPSMHRGGGIVGLDMPRANRFANVAQAIRTAEGVQSLVIKTDTGLALRYKVNRATASRIFAAYRQGRVLDADEQAISIRQYRNALLKARGDTIAETETANAVLSARDIQWQQFAEEQGKRPEDILKTWRHGRGPSKYHRPDHLAMAGTTVRGLHTPFQFPDGTAMQYAHDPAGGAKHVIRCGCMVTYRLDHKAGLL